jgi:predicted XRE-type DNA-binding protein
MAAQANAMEKFKVGAKAPLILEFKQNAIILESAAELRKLAQPRVKGLAQSEIHKQSEKNAEIFARASYLRVEKAEVILRGLHRFEYHQTI